MKKLDKTAMQYCNDENRQKAVLLFEMFKRQKDFNDRLVNDFERLNKECDHIFKSKFKEQPKLNLQTGASETAPNPEKI